MKRLIAFILALLLMAAVLPTAFAQENTGSFAALFDTSTGTLTVSGTGTIDADNEQINAYRGTAKHLVINEGITEIASSAFEGWEKLEDVRFPNSLEDLGGFEGCTSLKSITVPANVKYMRNNAFKNCSALSEISFLGVPKDFGSGVFENTAYKNDGANWNGDTFCIASWAIDARNYFNIVVPDGIRNVAIERKGLPEDGLFEIYIPASVSYISAMTRNGTFHVSPDNGCYCSGALGELLTKDGKILLSVPTTTTGDYVVPDGVERVEADAMIYMELGTVTLPDTVKQLGTTFFWCSKASLICLPDNLEVVESKALQGAYVDRFPRGLKTVESSAFCAATFPEGTDICFDTVPEIEMSAFFDACGINTVVLPEGMTELAEYAFAQADVKEVSFPASMNVVGANAFADCEQLKKITVRNKNCAFAPECEREDSQVLGVPGTTVICAPVGSTAEAYANKYGYEFEPLEENPTEFTDVKSGAWYEESVSYVAEHGIMAGIGDGQFDPDGTASRAMLAAILYRLAGCPEVSETAEFSDVKAGKWYTDAVTWVSENGYMVGVGGNRFGTEDPVTREQMAEILYRFAGNGEKPAEALGSFKDRNDVSAWAHDGVCWAVVHGLLSGRQNGAAVLLAPKAHLTRAELATVLTRLLTAK